MLMFRNKHLMSNVILNCSVKLQQQKSYKALFCNHFNYCTRSHIFEEFQTKNLFGFDNYKREIRYGLVSWSVQL